MSAINFFLRGTREIQKVYFRYRPNRNFDISLATPFQILSDNWDHENQQWKLSLYTKGAKTVETKLLNKEILKFNSDLDEFRNSIVGFIDGNMNLKAPELKIAINDFVMQNYFAHKLEAETKGRKPAKLSDLIDFYIDFRSIEDATQGVKPLAPNTVKKYKTLKRVVNDFDRSIKVTDINDVFRNNFIRYLNRNKYAPSTQVKYLKDVKMLCRFAEDEHSISKKVLKWKIDYNPEAIAKDITFTFGQLEKLKTTLMPSESLENARDWLLISCYTSVRVSELFTFEESNVIDDNGSKFIYVQEKKNRNHNGQGMKCIYLLPEVIRIMNQRGGKFPRKISEQKYNEYIKAVCEIAGFTDEVEGAKRLSEKEGGRKVKKMYPFYKLVSSHIGRRTFVTLFSQYLPSEVIQIQTNHHSREMVEHYDKTDLQEKLLQRAKVVEKAVKEINLQIS